MEDYFLLLDLDRDASSEIIKKRCQELLLKVILAKKSFFFSLGSKETDDKRSENINFLKIVMD